MGYNYQEYDDSEESKSRMAGLWIGIGITLLVVIVVVMIYKVTHPPLVPMPTAYVPITATDGAYKFDSPAGWKASSGDAGGMSSHTKVENGRVKIVVDSDLAGSLSGDIINAQNAQLQNMSDLAGVRVHITPVVEKVHAQGLEPMQEAYAKYSEQPFQKYQGPFGEICVSEFTADGGAMVGKLHGYRATMLSNERRLQAVTVCPDKNWSILQPAFLHVIQSIDRGSGQ